MTPEKAIDITLRCSRREWLLIRNNIVGGLGTDEHELIEYLLRKIDSALEPAKGLFDR